MSSEYLQKLLAGDVTQPAAEEVSATLVGEHLRQWVSLRSMNPDAENSDLLRRSFHTTATIIMCKKLGMGPYFKAPKDPLPQEVGPMFNWAPSQTEWAKNAKKMMVGTILAGATRDAFNVVSREAGPDSNNDAIIKNCIWAQNTVDHCDRSNIALTVRQFAVDPGAIVAVPKHIKLSDFIAEKGHNSYKPEHMGAAPV